MRRARAILLAGAFLALLGLAGYETSLVLRQRGQLAKLRQRAAHLTAESSALRRDCDAEAGNLAEAERQLAALPPLRAGDADLSPEVRTEIKAWLGRMKQLRRLFDEQPRQRIPEMQFLTEEDWLRVTKNCELDSDEGRRKVFAAAREAAISQFSPQLKAALLGFAKIATAEASPTGLPLGPYFEKPVDPALLERYELRKAAPSGLHGTVEWIVQNKAPIDPDYDSRFSVRASDSGNASWGNAKAPVAWIPDFQERLARAIKDFTAAGRTPSGRIGDVLPFFNPPLSPATVERIIRLEREAPK